MSPLPPPPLIGGALLIAADSSPMLVDVPVAGVVSILFESTTVTPVDGTGAFSLNLEKCGKFLGGRTGGLDGGAGCGGRASIERVASRVCGCGGGGRGGG